ncbi:hypothetical protein FQA47_024256 [Oryzias melastigma]|uniref:Uncharacterized protein n=1 Tax=Oryzias melastigma TaxID=30732 RepID=A0A834F266_ORYME|nr:hypothetical protein FQA47_024256 [Oryzias melastigma]
MIKTKQELTNNLLISTEKSDEPRCWKTLSKIILESQISLVFGQKATPPFKHSCYFKVKIVKLLKILPQFRILHVTTEENIVELDCKCSFLLCPDMSCGVHQGAVL